MLRIHVESNPINRTSCIDPIDPVKVNYIHRSRISDGKKMKRHIQRIRSSYDNV